MVWTHEMKVNPMVKSRSQCCWGYLGVPSQLDMNGRSECVEQSSVTAAAAVEAAKLDEWKAELLGEMRSLRNSVQAVAARPMQQQQLHKQPVPGA